MQPVPPHDLRPASPWTKLPPAPSSDPGLSAKPTPQSLPPPEAPSVTPPGLLGLPNRPPAEFFRPPIEEAQKGSSPVPETAPNTEDLLLEALRPSATPLNDGGLRPISFAPLWGAGASLHEAAKLAPAEPEREIVLSAARLIEQYRRWDELLQARRHHLYKA
ncbi:MAG: hypothetical protein PHO89_04805 [Methylacidiphilaceae bacterium]|nr:hypothetical protein [Candidatus Methylacidiphilaceae bacterium]